MAQDINSFLVTESGRITYDIYRREQYASPWISQPRKVAFPEGQGEDMTTIMWERPFIGTETGSGVDTTGFAEYSALAAASWGLISLSAGGSPTGNCIPPVDNVNFNQTLRRTVLFHKAVHSPKFCVTDLLFAGKREKQMQAIEWGLADMVRLYWVRWNRDGFTKLSKKYVVEGNLMDHTDETDGLKFLPTPATGRLTNEVLDHFSTLLLLEQGRRHAVSVQNGRPVFGLITDQATSRFLIRGDQDIREDFRYGKPDALLAPLGISHTYNGYIHMMDEMPPRYNFNTLLQSDSDGADPGDSSFDPSDSAYTDPWVEVPPYILVPDGEGGHKKEFNPAWLTAAYQDSYIYVKDAYQLRVPGSITGVSKAKFDPQTYMGDFKWQNVINLDESSDAYNPDGTMGRFRGVLKAGVEPLNPHVMFTIRHKVCNDLALVGCVGDSSV